MDIDELYCLPLDEFVPARNALARELRNSGKREEAAEVAAQRKPSVAGWAVNQLVRTQKRGVAELFEAGDALRAAHDEVLAGRGDASSLRAGVERERAAVDDLTGAARGLLTSQGHELSPTIVDRVADTLHAAALDDDARARVRDGRLERELRHVGLGMAASETTTPPPAPARRAAKTPTGGTKARQRAADARAEREERDRAERERAEARAGARATEREARRRLERAERAGGAAAERRDRAAKALDEAEAELAEAESELLEAREELGTAEEALRELGR